METLELVMECINFYDPNKRVIEKEERVYAALSVKGITYTFELLTSHQMNPLDMKTLSKTYLSAEEHNRRSMNAKWCQVEITKKMKPIPRSVL